MSAESKRSVMALRAVALALGLTVAAGAAYAQPAERGGPGPEQARPGNVVGGGSASLYGGSDDMAVVYSSGGGGPGSSNPAQSSRLARLHGGTGDGPEVEYLEPPAAGGGREAWLTGGGDDAQVVYASPVAVVAPPGQRRR